MSNNQVEGAAQIFGYAVPEKVIAMTNTVSTYCGAGVKLVTEAQSYVRDAITARAPELLKMSDTTSVILPHLGRTSVASLSIVAAPAVTPFLLNVARTFKRRAVAVFQNRTNRQILAKVEKAGDRDQKIKLLNDRAAVLNKKATAQETYGCGSKLASVFNYLAVPVSTIAVLPQISAMTASMPLVCGFIPAAAPAFAIVTVASLGFVWGCGKYNSWRNSANAQATREQAEDFSRRAEVLQLEKNLLAESAARAQATTQVTDLTRDKDTLTGQKTALENEANGLRTDKTNLTEANTGLRNENQQLSQQKTTLTQEVDGLKKEKTTLTSARDELQGANQQLSQQKAVALQEKTAAIKEKDRLTRDNGTLNAELNLMRETNQTLNGEKLQAEEQRDANAEARDTFQTQLTAARKLNTEKDEQIAQFQEQLADLTEQLKKMKEAKETAEQISALVAKGSDTVKDEVVALKLQVKLYEEKLQSKSGDDSGINTPARQNSQEEPHEELPVEPRNEEGNEEGEEDKKED